MKTFQDFVDKNKADGFSAEEIKEGFKERYGVDLEDFSADDDYDLFKRLHDEPKSKEKSFLSPVSPEERFAPDVFVLEEDRKRNLKRSPLRKEKFKPLPEDLADEKKLLDAASREDESFRIPVVKEIKELVGFEEDPNVRKASIEVGPSVAKVAGAVKGLGKEAVMAVADLAKGMTYLAGGEQVLPKEVLQPTSKTAGAIKSFGEEIEKGQKEKEKLSGLERAATVPLTVGKEVAHLVVDLASVVNELIGLTAKTPEEQRKGRFAKGQEIGEDFTASAIGVPVAVVKNLFEQPIAVMEEKPITAITALLPIAEALGAKPVAALGKAGKAWLNKYEATKKALEIAERPVSEIKRAISEPYKTREAEASSMIEEVFEGSKADKAEVKGAVAGLEREAETTSIEKPKRFKVEEAFNEEAVPPPKSVANEIEHLEGLKQSISDAARIKLDDRLISGLGRGVLDKIPVGEMNRRFKDATDSIKREIDDLERKIEEAELNDNMQEAARLSDLVDEKSLLLENNALPLQRKLLKDILVPAIDSRIEDLRGAKSTTKKVLKPEIGPEDIIEDVSIPLLSKPVPVRKRTLEKGEVSDVALTLDRELRGVQKKIERITDELGFSDSNLLDLAKEYSKKWLKALEQFHLRNVDAPKKYLRDLIEDDIQVNARQKGRPEFEDILQKDIDLLAELIDNERNAAELHGRIKEKMSETIRPPATSIDAFIVGSDGSLKKNLVPSMAQALESVADDLPEGASPELQRALKIEKEQDLGKSYVQRERESFLTNNPKWEAWIDRIDAAVKRLYAEGKDGLILSRERIASRFAEVLKDGAVSILLLSRGFRKTIQNEITAAFKSKSIPSPKGSDIAKILDEIPDRLNAKRRLFQILDEKGNVIYDLEEAIPRLLEKMPKKDKQKLVNQTILAIGEELAEEVEFHSLRNAIKAESQRFMNGKTIANPYEWVRSVLVNMLNDAMPPLFSPFEGKKVADILVDPNLRGLLANQIQRDLPNVSRAKIDALIDAQAKRFGSMEKVDVALLEKAYPEPAEAFKKTIPSEEPINNIYSLPEVASAFKWELESRAALRHPTKMMAFFSSLKRNLVARGLSSLVNNNISNYFLQAIRKGNPLVFIDIVKDGYLDWNKWKKDPKSIDPKKAQAYAAIESSGLIDVTELSRDIGKVPDAWYNAPGNIPGLKQMNRALEWGYSALGDIPFKVHEATSKYLAAEKALSEMDFGNSIFMSIGKNVDLQVQKISGGEYKVSFLDKNGNLLPGKSAIGKIDSPKVQQALGRAASFEANKIFFDYGDIGTWGKVIKSTPFLNAMSGFYTWYLKSLDIPFLKRGLFAEALFPLDFIRSNDPKIQQAQINAAFLLRTRKALILSGMTERVKQNGQEDIKKMAAFAPKYGNMIILSSILDPSNIYFRELSTTYPFKSLDTLLRVGAGAFTEMFLQPEDKKAILKDPEANRLAIKELSGEVWSKGDILELAGIGGNALVDVWSEIRKDDEWGTTKDISELAWDRLGPAIFGRTAFNSIRAGIIGGTAEAFGKEESVSGLSGYGKEQKKLGFIRGSMNPDAAGYPAYLIRQIAGLGWRKINLVSESDHPVSGEIVKSRYQQYLSNFSKELNAAVLKSIKEKGMRIQTRIDASSSKIEVDLLRKELSDLNEIYSELKGFVDNFKELEEERLDAILFPDKEK